MGKLLSAELVEERLDEVLVGVVNLRKHVEIICRFGVTPVIVINVFFGDYVSELEAVRAIASDLGVWVVVTTVVVEGGAGSVELAEAVVVAVDEPIDFRFFYLDDALLCDKIDMIVIEIYGADGVDYIVVVMCVFDRFECFGYGGLLICIAKMYLLIIYDLIVCGAFIGWWLAV